jgi:transcriptional regulator with XRE-family HTH domain
MARRTSPLLPKVARLLNGLGERLKLARLRRRLTAKLVAERAGMSVMTLRSLEAGSAGVTMGAYLSVMHVLGLEQDLNLLGSTDELGYRLQDSRLLSSKTSLGKKSASEPSLDIPKQRKLPTSHTSVIEAAYVSQDKLKNFPMNTHSLSELLTRKPSQGT